MSEIEFNKMAALKPVMAGIILKYRRFLFFYTARAAILQASNKIQPLKLIGTAIFDQQKEKFNYEYRHLNTLSRFGSPTHGK